MMTRVGGKDIPVLVRETSTTTYHLGLRVPICEARSTEGEADPVQVSLVEALDEPRRLCRECAKLIEAWTGAMLFEASATHLAHPDR